MRRTKRRRAGARPGRDDGCGGKRSSGAAGGREEYAVAVFIGWPVSYALGRVDSRGRGDRWELDLCARLPAWLAVAGSNLFFSLEED